MDFFKWLGEFLTYLWYWLWHFVTTPWDAVKRNPIFCVITTGLIIWLTPLDTIIWAKLKGYLAMEQSMLSIGIALIIMELILFGFYYANCKLRIRNLGRGETLVPLNPNWISFPSVIILITYIVACFRFGNSSMGYAGLAVLAAMFYGAETVIHPNAIFLSVFGTPVGMLRSGWYLILVPFMSAKPVSLGIKTKKALCVSVNTSQKTAIEGVLVKGRYRMIDATKAQDFTDDIDQEAEDMMMAQCKTFIGKKSFGQLIKDLDGTQMAMLDKLNALFNPIGYQFTALEIQDFNETVESRGRAIEVEGKAEAKNVGEKFKAIKKALEGKDRVGQVGDWAIIGAKSADYLSELLFSKIKNKKDE